MKRKIFLVAAITISYMLLNITSTKTVETKNIVMLNSKELAASQLTKKVVATGDGLYKDTYEDGKYIYKGTNPNNYIKFNSELWRILSVEKDGTLKLIKNNNIGNQLFSNSFSRKEGYCLQGNAPDWGCNAWDKNNNFVNESYSGTVTKEAELNTYLNIDYYNTFKEEDKKLIKNHAFAIGPVNPKENLQQQITKENSLTWTGNVGLISVSEFLKANTNISSCQTMDLNNTNVETCKQTNYLANQSYWTISPENNSTHTVFTVSSGQLSSYLAYDSFTVVPALYLKSDIFLKGSGTQTTPYEIANENSITENTNQSNPTKEVVKVPSTAQNASSIFWIVGIIALLISIGTIYYILNDIKINKMD